MKKKNSKRRRYIGFTLLGVVAVVLVVSLYNSYLSRTKIAFVNEQPVSLQAYVQSNNNKRIKLYDVPTDQLKKLKKYDIVLVNGMGLNITAEQRQQLKDLAAKGKPIYTSMATNPENNICTFSREEVAVVSQYQMAASRQNLRSLLNFLRRNVDGKISSIGVIEPATQVPDEYLYYPGSAEEDEQIFLSVSEFEQGMKSQGLWEENRPAIVVTGVVTDLTDLIVALSDAKYNVYPVSSMFHLVDYLEEIHPVAVVNAAHGRMGDHLVSYLKENNVLLFDPVYVNTTTELWEEDPMGMIGGFLSQSIVMPELDGAIRTSALFALEKDKRGLLRPYAIPDRLADYVQTITNYLELREKRNADKKLAIVYYKGPGQGSLVASGMDVVPSLYNLLVSLHTEGYDVSGLPSSQESFREQLQREGSLFNSFAAGDVAAFMKTGKPQKVSAQDYASWSQAALPEKLVKDVDAAFGAFPGTHNLLQTEAGELAFPRIQYGNVVLIPQPLAGEGKDEFRIVHGTNVAPPHSYIAPYLWARYGFEADALIHFGTHGSLEFTPQKQVALSSNDWPDRLVGTLPHFYLYTIDNVGEAMTARRRSYAGLQSYLTPPFHESQLRESFKKFDDKLVQYAEGKAADLKTLNLEIKKMAVALGLAGDLGLDSNLAVPYNDADIERLTDYKEELAAEKITDRPYILGIPYRAEDIRTSVQAMTVDPLAYSLYTVDRVMGRASEELVRHKAQFDARYLHRAESLINSNYGRVSKMNDAQLCSLMGITESQLQEARAFTQAQKAPRGMMAVMMSMANKKKGDDSSSVSPMMSMMGAASGQEPMVIPEAKNGLMAKIMRKQMRKMLVGNDANTMLEMARRMGADEEALKKMAAALGVSKDEEPQADTVSEQHPQAMHPQPADEKDDAKAQFMAELAHAVDEVETALANVSNYKTLLEQSPQMEIDGLMNALSGGYTAPSPGGDPIVNPNTLPTGRNLFAINAEETPTEEAWRKGVELAESTIANYRERHEGAYPRKVAYTLWSGEFVQTGGATIAQVLYMLGVEPVRDRYGRVNDLQLIPSERLGRPRIDVVVQTSGQLRDLATSRLFLISRAVQMAAEADGDSFENLVNEGVKESERSMIEQGVSPRDARRLSRYRVFGSQDGNYGTGIQSMVEKGDAWDEEREIAEVYINNMGAYYGTADEWMADVHQAFSAALTRTDVVVQPRQNNTWGALSLDHVYEFMGGMNLAVREVTGKDPDACFSDYRNRNHYWVQDSREAVATEARTKLFNKAYIQHAFESGETTTDEIAEMTRNLYGWNVMKPDIVGDRMWNELYEVYLDDKYDVGTLDKFAAVNPVAMQEMTATMLETARKGYWQASDEQLQRVATVYADFVNRFGPSGSSFDGDNQKLQQFVADHLSQETSKEYAQAMQRQRTAGNQGDRQAQVLEKQTHNMSPEAQERSYNGLLAVGIALVAFVVLVVVVRKRRRR